MCSTGGVPVNNMRMSHAAQVFVILLAAQGAVTPETFETKVRVSTGGTVLELSSAVATIEPRPNAPGYRWLRATRVPCQVLRT